MSAFFLRQRTPEFPFPIFHLGENIGPQLRNIVVATPTKADVLRPLAGIY